MCVCEQRGKKPGPLVTPLPDLPLVYVVMTTTNYLQVKMTFYQFVLLMLLDTHYYFFFTR